MWHLLKTLHLLNVINGVERWREASMHADDLILDDCCQWQGIEAIRDRLPRLWTFVCPDAFNEEAVNLCDLPTLMVAAQERDALFEAALVEEHQGDAPDAVVATIDIITEKEVVCLWHWPANQEELLEVEEVTVNITDDRDRTADRYAICLLRQNFMHPLTNCYHLPRRQLALVQNMFDLLIQVLSR
eukprot:TRINITY_DN18918_c0_g1_i3.p1 TRINITY_DN18918_c0_g1~~TRINITY_DN18918_c0_g1_i3.p1  ORF type:complete len:187 (+),score=23.58 TRINITY_DN18918_c0_g1_i3:163-723(+)